MTYPFNKLFFKPQMKLKAETVRLPGDLNVISYQTKDQDGRIFFETQPYLSGSEENKLQYRQLCWLLCVVNKTRFVNIDNEEILIEWNDEEEL